MNGTLALWYEGRTQEAKSKLREKLRPEVRIHVNLWRDLDSKFNFLDIGIQIANLDDLNRLYLYFPTEIPDSAVSDLSRVMKDESTLKAVFNDVAEVEREEDKYFLISLADGKEHLAVHHVDVAKDVTLEPVNIPARGTGTTLTFKSGLCRRLRETRGSNPYVRLRIQLGGTARNLFTTEDRAPGLGLSLAQDVIETTEFRLNERRSFPPDVFRRANVGRINLRSVHYFLIRRKGFQLGSQHQNFRKLRHLEADIWKGYLAYGRSRSARASARQAREMIIYQWRAIAEDKKGLDDFIAYASFTARRHQISLYLLAALAIGGIGNAVLNIAIMLIERLLKIPASGASGSLSANMLAILALAFAMALVVAAVNIYAKVTRRGTK